ncbi:hypothetical protein PENARI_c004G03829 [Penicillium arizonense]|uniref:Kinesin light chain n=1 Tax=Penicillium arizonense TaxID=1835702 RepID=A0A1F5LRD3_PENAI|nr:hypothetical protein PENARI_c004G03829 [Penicillium arizonense]OGE55580.1 hypothetical protein PENARI_c004G03829 [Penicillium arizonense]
MANLASTYRNQGRWKEAEELGMQVMEVHSRVLGPEHPDTLANMHNLAYTLCSQEEIREAIVLGLAGHDSPLSRHNHGLAGVHASSGQMRPACYLEPRASLSWKAMLFTL